MKQPPNLIRLGSIFLAIFFLAESTCPPKNITQKCSCQQQIIITSNLEVSCGRKPEDVYQLEEVTRILDNVRQTNQTLKWLKLRNGAVFNPFPSDLFKGTNVVKLVIGGNLSNFEPGVFAGLEQSLDELHLESNQFKRIPTEALSNLSALTSLILHHNQLEALDSDAFRGLSSLGKINLHHNRISAIHPIAFATVAPNLRFIDLRFNNLTSVPSEALRTLKRVYRIDLEGNQIRAISRESFAAFQSWTGLIDLMLRSNLISTLEDGAFHNLTSLAKLYLDHNQIGTIADRAFVGLEDSLKSLLMENNKLTSVPKVALANLTKLVDLILDSNQIHSIERDSFRGKFQQVIENIGLGKNQIETIEIGAFDGLSSLTWLNLKQNRLKHLPAALFVDNFNKDFEILNIVANPLECDCDLAWYQVWFKHQTKCEVKPNSVGIRVNATIGQVYVKHLDQHFVCNSTSV